MNSFDEEAKALDMLKFSNRRNVVLLFKRFLEIIESIGDGNDEAMDKLKSNLPDEYKKYVDLADYFTENKESSIRKIVLDSGNECIRNIERDLEQFRITFK